MSNSKTHIGTNLGINSLNKRTNIGTNLHCVICKLKSHIVFDKNLEEKKDSRVNLNISDWLGCIKEILFTESTLKRGKY